MSKTYKIIIYIPEADAPNMRQVLGDAGAGKIGNYTHCTFSVKGIGRFKPVKGANPTIGQIGTLEEVVEERIETVCSEDALQNVLKAIKANHPYEEPATDVFLLENI